MISQRRWRVAGGSCLLLCVIMVVMSYHLARPGISVWALVGYWGVFLLLLFAALYIAMLDFRYTRMVYKMTERELFNDTFMTPEFRQAVQHALKEEAGKQQENQPSNFG